MTIRKPLRPLLFGGIALMFAIIGAMMAYCLFRATFSIHLATLAILTTSGPLVARLFEGLVRRRQRVAGLEMNCLEADDEVLIARTVPFLMPVSGAFFSYFVML